MSFAAALKQFPELETKRLRLRQITEADAPAYYRGLSAMPHTSAWLDGLASEHIEKTRAAIRSQNNYFARAKTVIPWAMVNRRGTFIGFVRLSNIYYRSRAELAYWVAKRNWNKGFMTEAVEAVIAFGFEQLRLHRIYATADVDNVGSQRVLAKVGFRKEGVLRKHGRLAGEWRDSIMYGLLGDRPSNGA